nr:type II toxin-antitoxin system RelE/ParE family toxin [Enterococcus cecorum]
MIYQVNVSKRAENDLRNIYSYISVQLCAPTAARKQLNQLLDAIGSLEYFPERYKKYDEEPWKSRGLRTLAINNYQILYTVNLSNDTVNILAIIYTGRDLKEQLDSLLKE